MVVDCDRSAKSEVQSDGSEVHRWDACFPLGDEVYKVHFVEEPEAGQGMVVGLLKEIDERLGTFNVSWDDVEQAVLFFRLHEEAVVLIEAVQQEQPEVVVVDFEEVEQEAVIGILPVWCLSYLLQWDEEDHHGQQEQFGNVFHQFGIAAFHGESYYASIKPTKLHIILGKREKKAF